MTTRTRRHDPDTSHAAAAALDPDHVSRLKRDILEVLRDHPDGLTDVQIAGFFRHPSFTPSGLRTRRRELVDVGLVVDSGRRDVLPSGRQSIIWTIDARRRPEPPPPF